jgi:hypothetical protein
VSSKCVSTEGVQSKRGGRDASRPDAPARIRTCRIAAQFCAGGGDQQRCVGPSAWCCPQLLGGIARFVGFGSSISAKNGASASPAIFLQVGLVNGRCAPASVRRPINRPYQDLCYRSGFGSDCYSLVLCSGTLREGAWRQMEISYPVTRRKQFLLSSWPFAIGTWNAIRLV